MYLWFFSSLHGYIIFPRKLVFGAVVWHVTNYIVEFWSQQCRKQTETRDWDCSGVNCRMCAFNGHVAIYRVYVKVCGNGYTRNPRLCVQTDYVNVPRSRVVNFKQDTHIFHNISQSF